MSKKTTGLLLWSLIARDVKRTKGRSHNSHDLHRDDGDDDYHAIARNESLMRSLVAESFAVRPRLVDVRQRVGNKICGPGLLVRDSSSKVQSILFAIQQTISDPGLFVHDST
jgi:hypothetical protein